MKRDYIISVAMATFNGEKYIGEQLDSILSQLNSDDELIISDDGSLDNTLNIIGDYKKRFPQISLIKGPGLGVKKNFENAIRNCSGKYIFLSDQDDIWCSNKVSRVLEEFERNDCSCILHDCLIFDSNSGLSIYDSFFDWRNSKLGIFNNVIKNSFIGCCMAFSSEIKELILPIPDDIEMHDQWIGIIGEYYSKVIMIKDKLIRYRRHDNNFSKMHHHNIFKMIKNRFILIYRLITRKKRGF